MSRNRNTIRLEIETTSAGAVPLLNYFTGESPVLPRSRAIRWELVLLDNGVLDPAVGDITDITLEVKTYLSPSSAPLISKSISAVDINTALTAAERAGASGQHAVINFDPGDTGLDMTGANADNTKTFAVVITATRDGNLVTLTAGTVTMLNDGGQYSGNTPTAGDPSYYTAAQIEGMFASFLKILNEPGVNFIQLSPSGQWQRVFGVDDDGNRFDNVQKLF